MSFAALPVEILDLVPPLLGAYTFENFALSCKAAYVACKPWFAGYNQRRRRLADFEYGKRGKLRSDLQLLLALIEEPRAGEYIRRADLATEFRSNPYEEGDFIDFLPQIRAGDPETRNALRTFLKAPNSVLSDALKLKSSKALDKFYKENEELAAEEEFEFEWQDDTEIDFHQLGILPTLLALAFMPNLEELRPSPMWNGMENRDFEEAVHHFINEINDKSMGGRNSLPCRLRRVVAAGESPSTCSGQFHDYMDKLLLFLKFPTLEELYIQGCCSYGSSWDEGFTSNLRIVHLNSCWLDEKGMEGIAVATPRLEEFIYRHAETVDHYGFNVGSIVAVLGKHVGHCLKKLEISLESYLYGELETGIADMKAFKALEDVSLDVCLFGGPAPGSDDLVRMQRSEEKWDFSKTPCLADILPCSDNLVAIRIRAHVSSPMKSVEDVADMHLVLEKLFAMSRAKRALLGDCRLGVVVSKNLKFEGTAASAAERSVAEGGGEFMAEDLRWRWLDLKEWKPWCEDDLEAERWIGNTTRAYPDYDD